MEEIHDFHPSTTFTKPEENDIKNEWDFQSPINDDYKTPTHHVFTQASNLLSCYLCDYQTPKKRRLESHVLKSHTHTPEKPLHCNLCSFKTTYKCYMRRHMSKHTREKHFACTYCDFKSPTRRFLKLHLMGHNSNPWFYCYFCQYATYYKCALTAHLLSHTSEKQYKCNLCDDYCTRIKIELIRHMLKVHPRRRCRYCGVVLEGRASLRRHLKTHVGEVPFLCKVCGVKAESEQGLLQHMNEKHSYQYSYSCNVCGYCSKRKIDLNNHLKTHVGVKSCNLCEYNATLPDTMKDRIKIHVCNK